MKGNETLNLQPSTYCRMTYIKIILKLSEMQGFIEALLLTSVSHEGLSFMEVGHNPMCVSSFAPCSWGGGGGVYGGRDPPPPGGGGGGGVIWAAVPPLPLCSISPGSFGYFTGPRFSNSLSMHHSVI